MTALRIGLTGGIGSGKSTVGAMLAGFGAAVIDTDLIARNLALPGGAAIEAIRAAFGASFIDADGGLDRPRMRQAAFDDAEARRRLEAILHPLIGVEVERQAALAAGAAPVLVFDVPLLVESGRWRGRVDAVWLVDCDEALQIERVAARPGWSEAAARAVLAQQASRPARRAAADAVIHNQGISLAELAAEVRALWGHAISTRS
ncbi:MAG TPA: dephospho-CoA kinase [Caldimonas sp.]|jgi:dephospho-CoA kinase|nr:dephospho-CoA kinase [Caldimonas sp.]HEV7575694.1 dephospho-CoA kinase [Caldimonas sp.]